jgi:predicted PilT family ATPase
MRFSLFIISVLIIFSSCERDEEMKSVLFTTDSFTEVELNNSFNVFLCEDSVFSIEIFASEENMDNIFYKIENEVLKIYNERKYGWTTPRSNRIDVYINSEELSKVVAKESMRIQTINPITSHEFGLILENKANEVNLELDCQSFYYWDNKPCGGNLTLSGFCDNLKIWNYAIMSVDAQNLVVSNAIVVNDSQGDCRLNVTNKLEYSIDGTGDIYLYSSPTEIILNRITSSGRLIQL